MLEIKLEKYPRTYIIHEAHDVLVVDDEPMVATLTGKMLEKNKYHPVVTYHTLEARALIEQIGERRIFDYILTDLTMPGKPDGYEFAKWCSQNNVAEAIIIMTGHTEMDTSKFLQEGYAVLMKPFSMAKLMTYIAPLPPNDRS